jgi:integration host factor subunit alpha
MTLTKADLVDSLVQELNVSRKDAVSYSELIFETIKGTLERGEHVKISGFGNWNVRDKRSRVGRNPQTGQAMEIASRKVVTFKPSQILRDILNNGESLQAKQLP